MEFVNPWFMAAGGALVSSPVLIHLINRMRFKRVRWAAMEFLLKSQKRNRRKLIIEQLILLALRCLLVLLVGMLLGRLRLGGDTGQNAFHFVVLDDTPSMGDHFVENGKVSNSFDVAKEQLKLLADTIAQASTRQQMRVVLLSNLDDVVFDQQLNNGAGDELAAKMQDKRPAAIHVDPIQAVEKARLVFSTLPRGKKIFHFVSDFRESDWKTGPDAEALAKAVDGLTAIGAHVSYIDTAHRFRGASEEGIAPHANLAIEDLKPATTIAAEGVPVEFTVGVHNYSTEAKKTFMHVYTRTIYVRDGKVEDGERLQEDLASTGVIDNLQPGNRTEKKFTLLFQKKQPGQLARDGDKPEERARKRRADAEFVQVSVKIDDDPQDMGLEADNARDVIVEVRKKVPTLVVDGNPTRSRKRDGDLYYLESALGAAASYEMERCTIEELDKVKLEQYPDVFFVNVPFIKNDDTIKKLEDYVSKGGSVAFFMGDLTDPVFYNKLFKESENRSHEHLFPVLLDTHLPEPMSDDEKADRLQNDKQPKILFPDESNPIIRGHTSIIEDKGGLAKNQDALRYLLIDRYWKCLPQSQWDPEPNQAQKVVVLPNRNSIDQYKRSAQETMQKVALAVNELATDDEKWEVYKDRVEAARKKVVEALSTPYLDNLYRAFDVLMHDPGVKDNPSRPNMAELWAQPKMRALKNDIDDFLRTVRFGDPLVVTRPFGKGRVLAFLTTAGTSMRGTAPNQMRWNEWASGLALWTYPVFIKQMQEYLISQSDSRNRIVGTDLVLPDLEAARYKPEVRISYQPQPDPWNKAAADRAGGNRPALQVQPIQPLTKTDEVYKLTLPAVEKTGVYTFEFFPNNEAGGKPTVEVQAYAFNMDSAAESDLNRATKETLVRKTAVASGLAAGGKVVLRSPGDSFEDFKDPPPDLSNMIVLFILIALVFAAEQALAVHLSFHLKENEAAVAAPPRGRRRREKFRQLYQPRAQASGSSKTAHLRSRLVCRDKFGAGRTRNMSIAHGSQSPAPPWAATRVQAVLGLLLFVLLLAGFIAYGFLVLLPDLLKDNIELIFERYNTLLPDLINPAMPAWLKVWAAAGVLGALVVSGAYIFQTTAVRQSRAGLFWAWLGALAALLAPPLLLLFLFPGAPKFPGGSIWWFLTAFGLTGGFFYVAWMYYRDSHGVGPLWASLLGLLRATVFSVLAFFFMLPAVRDYKDSFSRSKVLVLFDVSGSMAATIDDIPTDAVPLDKLLSRQDKVVQFLADEKVHFLKRLEEKNPIDAFRFARGLDPEYLHFSQDDRNWTRGEYDAWVRNPNRDKETPLPEGLPLDFWKTWLKPAVAVEAPADLSDAQQERFRRFLGLNDALVKKDADYLNNTNVGDSVLSLLDNESKKMLQGVVIFTDGRSTEGSSTGFAQVEDHAKAAHVPIFVVGIGEERPQVKIEIADLRVPQQIQPDDKFPAVVEITGEGLPDKDINPALELTYSRKGKEGKEEQLPIVLMESIDAKPGDKLTQPQTVSLGRMILIRPTEQAKFDKGSPPRVEVSYQIDALALAAAAGVDLKAFPNVRKWEIAQTLPDAELRFRARVPKDSQEIFGLKDHVSDPAGMVVQKKPLRILLFASAATHEYQFVQAMLVRDMTKQRVKVASYLQMAPGRTEPRDGIVQDAPLLKKFPDQIDRKFSSDDDKLYDLSEYDVIVAFDPDWSQLSEEQIKLFKQWADKGGGFIDVAGPVNTLQLARPSGAAMDRLKPILQLLPVTLRDIRLEEANRDTDRAWPLDFSGATPDMEFLKLAEESGDKGPPPFLADWKDFFGPIQPDGSVNRGFYNFYPVENAKSGAQVVARFADPRAKLKDGSNMPYIVLSNPADPDHRMVWIGWGEMWRLRQQNEAYLERFWTKLTRYAGALNQGKVVKRITPNFGRVFTVNQSIVMEARIDDKGGVRLNENAKPKVVVTPPLLGPKMTEQQKLELENLQKEKWMSYKPKSDGWFQVKFKPPVEGDYTMDITVNETGDKISHKFTVKPSNPELDNVRPDFARMYEMSSYADEDVQPRMSAADYTMLLQKLQRPKLDDTQKDDRPRLYFNLKNAAEIPQCMDKTSNQRRDYSDPRPIWNTPVRFFEGRVQLGWYAFTVLVGLMSLEWLIRKLLRLA